MQIKRLIQRLRSVVLPALAAALCAGGCLAAPTEDTRTQPHLAQRGNPVQLLVDGQPSLMLAGELHNSSSSSLQYMEPVWPQLAGLHLNTVLAPVAWETIEPQEDRFDFSTVDGLLKAARNNHLKLVIL